MKLKYRTYMIVAIGSIVLGLNFLFLTPAFMPFSIDKLHIGLAFLACGGIKLALLLFRRDRNDLLRLSMTTSIFLYTFWAAASVYEFFARSQTSLQQPIVYMIVAGLAVVSLLEPYIGGNHVGD